MSLATFSFTLRSLQYVQGSTSNLAAAFPTAKIEELSGPGGLPTATIVAPNNIQQAFTNVPLQSGSWYRVTIISPASGYAWVQWPNTVTDYTNPVREISATNTVNLTFDGYFAAQTAALQAGIITPAVGSTLALGFYTVSGWVIPPVGLSVSDVQVRFELPDRSAGGTFIPVGTSNNYFLWIINNVVLNNVNYTNLRVRVTYSNGVTVGQSFTYVITGSSPPPTQTLGTITATVDHTTDTSSDPGIAGGPFTFTIQTRDTTGQPMPNVSISEVQNNTQYPPIGSTNTSGVLTYQQGFVPGTYTIRFVSGSVTSSTITIVVTLLSQPGVLALQISTNSVQAGGSFTASVTGATGASPNLVTISLGTVQIGTITPSSTGTGTVTCTVPSTTTAGLYSVTARYGTQSSTQPLTVTTPSGGTITGITLQSDKVSVTDISQSFVLSGTLQGTGTLSGLGIGLQVDGANLAGTQTATSGFGAFSFQAQFTQGTHTVKVFPVSFPSITSNTLTLTVGTTNTGSITGITATYTQTPLPDGTAVFTFSGQLQGTGISNIPIGAVLDGTQNGQPVATTTPTGSFAVTISLAPGTHTMKFFVNTDPTIQTSLITLQVGNVVTSTGTDWQKYGVMIAAAALAISLLDSHKR